MNIDLQMPDWKWAPHCRHILFAIILLIFAKKLLWLLVQQGYRACRFSSERLAPPFHFGTRERITFGVNRRQGLGLDFVLGITVAIKICGYRIILKLQHWLWARNSLLSRQTRCFLLTPSDETRSRWSFDYEIDQFRQVLHNGVSNLVNMLV